MRFFVNKIMLGETILDKDSTAHLKASRIKVGQGIVLFDGSGCEYNCILKEYLKNTSVISVNSKVENGTEAQISVTLFMSMIKPDRFELAVQKATELGVSQIIPMITRYAQPYSLKFDRLNKIVIGACEQCGRAVLPKIRNPIYFDEMIKSLQDFDTVVFSYENERVKSIRDLNIKQNSKIALLIGPEGGFADFEVKMLSDNNIEPVTLGKRILKSETAAICALTAVYLAAGEL